VTSPDPARDRREADQGRQDLKRTGRSLLLGLIALIVVVAIAVALTNLGGDDDPSGGGEEGLGEVPAGVELTMPSS
jgi:hypothetical protein